MQGFDDTTVRAAMRDYLTLADRLATASAHGEAPRDLVDLAELKTVAGMVLHKRLIELGWQAPAAQRVTT